MFYVKYIDKFFYWIIASILLIYFKLYHRLEVLGKEFINKKSSIIVASNHASFLDPPCIGVACLPNSLNYIAIDYLFKFPPLAWVLRISGALPISVDTKASSAGLIVTMTKYLKEGKNVFVCPEGQRTPDGHLCPLQGGVALMSIKSGSPVIPTYIAGSYHAMSRHVIFPRPYKLRVIFGEPIDPKTLPSELTDKEKRKIILDKLLNFYKEQEEKYGID